MSLPLSLLLSALEELAPLRLAEEWDNVGLLVDPRALDTDLNVQRVLLTIDATGAVLREAVERRIQCLVAYHPPLFHPRKRINRRSDAAIFAAAAANFAIYSPHTALDAAPQGINDWLASGLGRGAVSPLLPATTSRDPVELKLVVFVPKQNVDALRQALADAGAGLIGAYSQCSYSIEGEGSFWGSDQSKPVVGQKGQLERVAETRLEMVCPVKVLPLVSDVIRRHHPYEEPAWDVYPLVPKPQPNAGSGRLLQLEAPCAIERLLERVKRHLALSQVRAAISDEHLGGARVRSIAVCAGSAGRLFERAPSADLYLSGELGHHDVLDKLANGKSVILCEHTNTERGYLPKLRDRLLELTHNAVEVELADSDYEPLRIC